MNVKTASRVARSLKTRSRSLDNLADGYLGNRRRSFWGGEADQSDIDPNVAAEIQRMSDDQARMQIALENATVVVDFGGGDE